MFGSNRDDNEQEAEGVQAYGLEWMTTPQERREGAMAYKNASRRYVTRLRFEPGQPIPLVGDRWHTETELGRVPVLVTLLEVRQLFEHPDEPGVMLMDCRISRRDLA